MADETAKQYEYGLYVHIPFCQSRCRYCDFYTLPAYKEIPEPYIDAILRDFIEYSPKDEAGNCYRPATVYFGGGTPGLLSPKQVGRLLDAFAPQPDAEITLETNPELAGYAQLAGWQQAGVNRLSIGVQTAKQQSLRRLGRLHTPADVETALDNARRAGFHNITGDIMLALPGYSNQEFDSTLSLLQNGGVVHLSAYLLKIEDNTAFARNIPENLPNTDEAAQFYLYAVGMMERAGYAQYEISNFAKPGFEGRHNSIYWNMGDWLGLGPAAHSCLNEKRFYFDQNALPLDDYLKKQPKPVWQEPPDVTDYLMMRLRLVQGVDESVLLKRYGRRLSCRQQMLFEQLTTAGYAKKTAVGWALTPEGMLVQNEILVRFFNEETEG